MLAKSIILLFVGVQTFFMLCSVNCNAQYLLINEIMSSNFSAISDEDGDYEDWIELYNDTDTIINLEGFSISDDFYNPQRWTFPEVILEPGEFLLIFASGKNRAEGDYLHTNFSISKDGEPLILSNPQEEIIDYIPPVYIPTDISYGRSPDASFIFKYFKEPTPGSANVGETFSEVLSPVQFSRSGGFYTDEFTLQLSHPDPNVTIVYTLDGSEPDINNIDGTTYLYKDQYPFFNPEEGFGDFLEKKYYSHIYDNPIYIYHRETDPDKLTQISTTVNEPYYFPESPVYKGTVVRAKPFKENAIADVIATQSYFVTRKGRDKFPIPVISLSVQEDALFDYYDGIYTPGVDADNWRKENPDDTVNWWNAPGNYRRRGFEWEYPANFEYFPQEHSSSVLNQNVGIRIHGGASRVRPQKSFRLYARNIYNATNINYNFFNYAYSADFKRLLLRNSGNDTYRTLFRDAAIQTIVKDLNFDTQAYQPTVMFINGEFWGVHNIRERYDKHYLNRVYGIEEGKLDLLTHRNYAKEGDNIHYNKTIQYIEEHGLDSDSHYQHILTKIDVDNFMDYQIAQIFINNTDWPSHNIDFWRMRTTEYNPNASEGKDGRWRWLMYDTDYGFGYATWTETYTYNTLKHAVGAEGYTIHSNPDWSTFLLSSFLENETFKQDFIDRFEYHLINTFNTERVINIIDSIAEIIEPIMPYHSHRWSKESLSIDAWHKHINVMRKFAEKRPCLMRNMIIDFFEIENDYYAIGACEESNINERIISHAEISIYPNPVKNKLFVKLDNSIFSDIRIEIYDNTGRKISGINKKPYNNYYQLDVSGLESGLYLISIVTDNFNFTERVIVM